ncbi:MAG: flagellar export chaperone FliS [Syntrophales bacterium]|jgi:flagellar protein FliS|nr:flagellar export chaperone FliS [Syntrophales bacterium]
MFGSGAKNYRRVEVETADPKRLVILCYESVLGNLRLARSSYESGEFEVKANALQKALDVICELRNALDFERGGEIARNLDALYGYMNRRLLEADLSKDLRGIDEVIGMLEDLESAWKEIFYGRAEIATEEAGADPARMPYPAQAVMSA